MKCPECGEEMEEGYVTGAYGFFWAKKKKFFYTLGDEDTERLFVRLWDWYQARLVGYKCSKCEMIIFYYGERGERLLKEKEENGEG